MKFPKSGDEEILYKDVVKSDIKVILNAGLVTRIVLSNEPLYKISPEDETQRHVTALVCLRTS